MQPEANVDLESWVAGVGFVSFGASLKGLLVFLESLFEMFDAFSDCSSLLVEVVLSSLDGDAERFANASEGN